MTRNEIIRNTAAEIVALHDQDALDESVVELLLACQWRLKSTT